MMQDEVTDNDYYDDDLDWVFDDVSSDESCVEEEIKEIMQRGKITLIKVKMCLFITFSNDQRSLNATLKFFC